MTQPTFIFTYSDGSRLYKLPAKAFVTKFPVWEANRTLDPTHVTSIESSIKSPTELQGLFSVISYLDEEKKVLRQSALPGRSQVFRPPIAVEGPNKKPRDLEVSG